MKIVLLMYEGNRINIFTSLGLLLNKNAIRLKNQFIIEKN